MTWLFHSLRRLRPALLLALVAPVFGQEPTGAGSVFGLVREADSGVAITNVAVSLSGSPLRGVTGSDGRYAILLVPPGVYEVSFAHANYERQVVREVRVVAGEATPLDVTLRLPMFELELMEVMADPLGGFDGTLILERQEDPVFKNAIGAEMISQLGLGDAAEAVGKVSGASVAGGKYAVIRGLGDRYTSTMLNGTDFPSADPNRKAAQLDLVPSDFIQQLDVAKTFSPDLPGGFSGGAIDIVTRRYPEEFLFNFKAGLSYDTHASLRDDFLISDRGSTDWLGFDDGTRELSDVAANTPANSSQNLGNEIKSSFGSRQFSPMGGQSPLDSSFGISVGDSQSLGGRRFGYLAGITYKNDWDLYTDGRVRKYDSNGTQVTEDKSDARGVIEYTWGAMVALGYELAEGHELAFNFLRVQTAEDEARRLTGQSEDAGTNPDDGTYLEQTILAWTERSLTYYQLLGEHEFPALGGAMFNWVGALSSTTQDEPDLRVFQFVADPVNNSYTPFGPARPERPNRTWRTIKEDGESLNGDFEIPLPSYNSRDNSLKLGGAYNGSQREYFARSFDVRSTRQNTFYQTGDPQDYLSPTNEPFTEYRNFSPNFAYSGEQGITGTFLTVDWAALAWLRLTGGARFESTSLSVDTVNLTSGQTYAASINQEDWLPALNATIYLRENLQLKLAWSETLVRPIYREISRAAIYDVALARQIQGHENNRLGSSENFDLRVDWYPWEGSLISASLFRKNITDPIELIQIAQGPDLYQYTNYSAGTVQGVEFELRENLGNWWAPLRRFNLGFNAALIKSEVELLSFEQTVRANYGETSQTRSLYDQPDYILNADLTWVQPEWGTTLTVSGGVVGERLIAVGTFAPDEFLKPAPSLDVFVTQNLGRRWKLRASAKNLLDPEFEVAQKWPTAGPLVRTSFTKGMEFGLSLGFSY